MTPSNPAMKSRPKKNPSRLSGFSDVGEVEYEDWYPEVSPVMDTKQLAELLHANEQTNRAWAREGIIPAHQTPGGRASSPSSAKRSPTG